LTPPPAPRTVAKSGGRGVFPSSSSWPPFYTCRRESRRGGGMALSSQTRCNGFWYEEQITEELLLRMVFKKVGPHAAATSRGRTCPAQRPGLHARDSRTRAGGARGPLTGQVACTHPPFPRVARVGASPAQAAGPRVRCAVGACLRPCAHETAARR